ncbi:MAG TPA: DUF4412 domain-containing protein [Puia sp.]|nr:DUF4412 domain-containing protein [Puia sp.]
MKKLTLVLSLLAFLQVAQAQFEGILTYDCTIKNKTLTSVYCAKTKVLLESKIYPMKGGAADITAGKEQDDLLFDFDARKVYRISSRHKVAASGDMGPVSADRFDKIKSEDISVEDKGEEKVGDYNCHHFVVKMKNKQLDLWITKDLGSTPVCMVSQFDYFPMGSVLSDKLKAAGADGIVVRSNIDDVVVNLTSVQRKTVPASYFELP